MNAALTRKGSTERVDHRSFKARGIERLPTVHVGKKGTAARGRAGLNARLRAKNAQVLALEEQMRKLRRMKARLAARAESTPDPQHAVPVVEDRASDLSPWRRAKEKLPSSRGTGAVVRRSSAPSNQQPERRKPPPRSRHRP